MQINLLSLFSSTPDAAANGLTAPVDSEVGDVLTAVTPEQFDQLFEGKLADITAEGAEILPTPKLMAAFLQRLHLVSPEAEGLSSNAVPGLPQLTSEQLEAMARVLGVDPASLQLKAAEFAEHIFPPGEGVQHESVTGIVSVLRELTELGQKLHQNGLTVGEISLEGEVELEKGSILTLISSDEASQEFGLSDESIETLAVLFGVPTDQIQENVERLRIVSAEETAKSPGLLQLLSHVLDQPVEEIWDQLGAVTDGEADLPFGVVLSAFVKETVQEVPLSFDLSRSAGVQSGLNNNIELNNDISAEDLKKALHLPTDSNRANAGQAEKELGLEPLPRSRQQGDLPLVPAEAARRNNPLNGVQARPVTPRSAAILRENSVQPLLRESAERPIETRGAFESSSSLALSAADSKLDFDAKLRESRSFNNLRANVNPNSVREQVAVQVKQGIEKGETNINVRLRPMELGRVDVRIEVAADGRTTLAVVADNRDTLELLQRDSRSLEKAFAELGMEMSEEGMSFDLQEQFAGDQQEQNDGAPANEKLEDSFDTAMARPDEMIAEALLDGSNVNYMVGVDDGLNIKV